MPSPIMIDALGTVFRRFKSGSRATSETLVFLSIYELSMRNRLITTYKIKNNIRKKWDRTICNSQIRIITNNLSEFDLIRIVKESFLRIYELKDMEKLYDEMMLLSEGLTKLFSLIDEIVQLTEKRYQAPPRVTEEELLEVMIQALLLTKENIVLRVGKEFVKFLSKCETVISDLDKMGREIRIIIPKEIKVYPMAMGKHIIRKKEYQGLYLNIDDGESILQLKKDGNTNIRCYIHYYTKEISSTFFRKNLKKDKKIMLVTK